MTIYIKKISYDYCGVKIEYCFQDPFENALVETTETWDNLKSLNEISKVVCVFHDNIIEFELLGQKIELMSAIWAM